MLHVDIPTASELSQLVAARGEALVSIYLDTTPETQHVDAARTRLKQLRSDAVAQLEQAGRPKRSIWPIEEQLNDLMDDDEFWRPSRRPKQISKWFSTSGALGVRSGFTTATAASLGPSRRLATNNP